MSTLDNALCLCGPLVCTCSPAAPATPAKMVSSWMPPTPATSSRKPAVTMPGWTATSSPSLSLSTSAAMTVTPRTSSMIAPEIGGVRDPVYLPSDKALELISNLDSVLAEKDHTIAALTMQHEDDLTTLTLQHEEAMAAMQDKYNALYFHCTSMAKDIRRKDTMLDCLKDADRAHRDLCAAQQELARSTMALAKNHRTKFVSDRHQLVYRSTESTTEVKQEMSLANKRLRAEKAKQERAFKFKVHY